MAVNPDGRVVSPADAARQMLARTTTLSSPAFVRLVRRHAESRRWATMSSGGDGPIRFIAARGGRLVGVTTKTWEQLTQRERDVVDEFGDAGIEIHLLPPTDIAGAEAVFD